MSETVRIDPSAPGGRLDAIYEAAFWDCRPLAVLWELTYACNLRCRHCYVEPEDAEPMTLRECTRALDELARAGVLFLVLSGGEPLTRPDFVEILQAAAEREFALRVLTNGTLLGEREADALARAGTASVDVSVYGREEVHDRVTGVEGSFARTQRALELLRARGLPITIKTPLLKSNRGELSCVRALAREFGAGLVVDVTVVPSASGGSAPLAEQLPEEEMLAVLRELSGGRPVPGGGNLEPLSPLCSAGRSTARLTPSGMVTPCVAIGEAAGSLRRSSFAEIWRSPRLERLRAMRLDDLPACRACGLRGHCVRCPGLALAETGDIAAASPAACRLARVLAALSGGTS